MPRTRAGAAFQGNHLITVGEGEAVYVWRINGAAPSAAHSPEAHAGVGQPAPVSPPPPPAAPGATELAGAVRQWLPAEPGTSLALRAHEVAGQHAAHTAAVQQQEQGAGQGQPPCSPVLVPFSPLAPAPLSPSRHGNQQPSLPPSPTRLHNGSHAPSPLGSPAPRALPSAAVAQPASPTGVTLPHTPPPPPQQQPPASPTKHQPPASPMPSPARKPPPQQQLRPSPSKCRVVGPARVAATEPGPAPAQSHPPLTSPVPRPMCTAVVGYTPCGASENAAWGPAAGLLVYAGACARVGRGGGVREHACAARWLGPVSARLLPHALLLLVPGPTSSHAPLLTHTTAHACIRLPPHAQRLTLPAPPRPPAPSGLPGGDGGPGQPRAAPAAPPHAARGCGGAVARLQGGCGRGAQGARGARGQLFAPRTAVAAMQRAAAAAAAFVYTLLLLLMPPRWCPAPDAPRAAAAPAQWVAAAPVAPEPSAFAEVAVWDAGTGEVAALLRYHPIAVEVRGRAGPWRVPSRSWALRARASQARVCTAESAPGPCTNPWPSPATALPHAAAPPGTPPPSPPSPHP